MNFSTADIWIMVISGAVGYLLRKFGYEMAPLLLALVLGDRLEENFRLALTMSGGSYATFVDQRVDHRADVRARPAAGDAGLGLGIRLPKVARRPGRKRMNDGHRCVLTHIDGTCVRIHGAHLPETRSRLRT